jgi:hypothetical protein
VEGMWKRLWFAFEVEDGVWECGLVERSMGADEGMCVTDGEGWLMCGGAELASGR